ncbi:MAG: DUF5615 family PIN-like protein [Prevotella sp.]|jgi:predicted nuclease of predicted toxin-antitoxin system|nr:DUF5615 family PIN-like protein [Prevotella sp.]
MKLLFDQNISYRILNRLPDIFFESQQVRTVGLENETDMNIWKYAKNNRFTIVTFDADFYEISLINGHPPKIVWLRTGNLTTLEIVNRIIVNYSIIADFIDNTEQGCMEIY